MYMYIIYYRDEQQQQQLMQAHHKRKAQDDDENEDLNESNYDEVPNFFAIFLFYVITVMIY